MPEDQTRDQNQIGTVAKETTPPSVVAPDLVENLATPTHTEVPIPQPLRDIGVAQIPVPKLPDEEGMRPSPPNFGSIEGDLDLPIPIERARELANKDPRESKNNIARVEVHEVGKLRQRIKNLARAA